MPKIVRMESRLIRLSASHSIRFWPPFHVGIVGRRRWTNVTFVYTHSVYFIRYKILEAIGGKYSSELFSFWFC
ncbi:unnamed protein product [Lactuca virosa]|uniref:Uncharacterized protein n=1 Tax=Lactuca virosa TaxID=75947 RepID=A0AAU9N2N4_9ASTR|nr:unnamed protein product [Lactuca virosa]